MESIILSTSQSTKIKVAHSPDSDDAFMFYAIKFGKVDLHGFEFEIDSDEIDVLNQQAMQGGDYDIFAVSFHAYHYLKDRYKILRAGASMAGKDYGPRLVTNRKIHLNDNLKIAVPGKYTSAFLVLQAWLKTQMDKVPEYIFCSYNEVFDLLESGQVDASLLIHESQLKFQEQNLELIVDLGQWWFEKYHLQMPLGCNVINRTLGEQTIESIDQILQNSIKWGLENFDEVLEYSRKFADNKLDDEAARRYINMYVNESTVSLTEDDLKSIEILLSYKN